MKSFVIKKLDDSLKLVNFNGDIEGFNYKPRNKGKYIQVNSIIIVNDDIIRGLIKYNFDKKYKSILETYLMLLSEDEEGEDGLFKILDDIARLRSIMIRKYKRYLKEKDMIKFLKKLKIVENEIRTKIINIELIKNEQKNIVYEEKKGKGR